MIETILATGLTEKDFMTLRWNANVHTVHRKTGEIFILNSRGLCIGELMKGTSGYLVVGFNYGDNVEEINSLKQTSEMVLNREIVNPELISERYVSRHMDYLNRNYGIAA